MLHNRIVSGEQSPDDLLPLKEAAAYLHRQPCTLYRWRHKKSNPIPCMDIAGRIFYRRADLDKFKNIQ